MAFEKQVGRDQVPVLYGKDVVHIIEGWLNRGERLAKEALLKGLHYNDKSMLLFIYL